jgi:3-hydroxyisobutyrate dehydrogenase-like beta-hydroxyacid dehydrogenase
MNPRVCLLGFGEVGQALVADLRPRVDGLGAWDLKFADSSSAVSLAAGRLQVLAAADPRSAVANADVVVSAVTAAQIGEAARSVANHLKSRAYYFDLNSTSPAAKQAAATVIDSAGGRFVEATVMSAIEPRRAASPMLLGGPHAAEFLPVAMQLGFTGAQVFSEKLGAASAAKMCRSVVIKGLEALMLESLLTARKFGVEQVVLESLQSTFSAETSRAHGRYMISRALVHGRRRAEEMREVARTVTEAGLVPRMSGACAEWQEWAAGHSAAATNEDLEQMLDLLLTKQHGAAPC